MGITPSSFILGNLIYILSHCIINAFFEILLIIFLDMFFLEKNQKI